MLKSRDKLSPKVMSETYELETIEMPNEIVTAHLNNVQGRVLTLIDALFAASAQNKAVKDTVKSFFAFEHEQVWRFCHPTVKPLTEAEMSCLKTPKNTSEVNVIEVPLKNK